MVVFEVRGTAPGAEAGAKASEGSKKETREWWGNGRNNKLQWRSVHVQEVEQGWDSKHSHGHKHTSTIAHLYAAGAPVQNTHDLARLAVHMPVEVEFQQVAKHIIADAAESSLRHGSTAWRSTTQRDTAWHGMVRS